MIDRSDSILVHFAWTALLQQKLRAVLSISGVVCGVTAVIVMGCIGEGAKQEAITQIERLGTRNVIIHHSKLSVKQAENASSRHSQGLSGADALHISDALPGLADLASLEEIQADVDGESKNFSPQVVAVSAGYPRLQPVQLLEGRFICDLDLVNRNRVAVIGIDVATSIRQGLGGVVRIDKIPFEIIGIAGSNGAVKSKAGAPAVRNYAQMLFIPLGTQTAFDEQMETKTFRDVQHLSEIIVQLKGSSQSLPAAQVIDRILAHTHNGVKDYTIVAPYQLIQQLKQTQRTFNIILGAISGISLLVGGIGIMNIMLATVSERKKEIGVRRAVGASRRDIWLQFLAEAILLTCVGGVAGVLVGFGTVLGITRFTDWDLVMHWWTMAVPMVMSLVVGAMSGVYPALQATRIDPLAALRSE